MFPCVAECIEKGTRIHYLGLLYVLLDQLFAVAGHGCALHSCQLSLDIIKTKKKQVHYLTCYISPSSSWLQWIMADLSAHF